MIRVSNRMATLTIVASVLFLIVISVAIIKEGSRVGEQVLAYTPDSQLTEDIDSATDNSNRIVNESVGIHYPNNEVNVFEDNNTVSNSINENVDLNVVNAVEEQVVSEQLTRQ